MRFLVCSTYLLLILMPATGYAISKYIDEDGRTVFVDDESKIPARYLDKSQDVEGVRELTDEEKQAQAERLRKAREQQRQELNRKRGEMAEQELRKLMQTPVIIDGPRVLVPVEVTLGNRTAKLNLLLDTGASRTVLHDNALGRLDLDADEGITTYGVGVGGYKVKMRLVTFRSIKVGPYKSESAQALVIPHRDPRVSFDGLLGMDFLRYISYEIDYSTQTIHWQP